ncbi:MAG: hypothetical protein KDA67_03845 [Rhodobacteraceae bacterium]|nr:hypothetical protein [Paracoccaceae bacterium]
MRLSISIIALLALAACDASAPNDGQVAQTLPAGAETVATLAEDGAGETAADQGNTGEPVVITADNPTISDTQDFDAVTERLTIEDDKAILAAQREKFKEIEPTALPTRNGKTVNVVEYALKTTNNVGEKLYSRLNPLGATIAKRNCARYRQADDAQLAFLESGGPKRDSKNLDPDGDGFACGWSPDTYRNLVR